MDEIRQLLRAVKFSAEKHRDQRRKGVDKSPYVNHPIEVAEAIASVAGVSDVTTLVAAVLHDTIEDTHTTPEEIETAFGREVRLLVQEVTDDKSLPKAERKQLQIQHASDLSVHAKLIKIADKASNARDVKDHPAADWSLERRREYLDFCDRVVKGCRGINAPLERYYDDVVRESRKALASEA